MAECESSHTEKKLAPCRGFVKSERKVVHRLTPSSKVQRLHPRFGSLPISLAQFPGRGKGDQQLAAGFSHSRSAGAFTVRFKARGFGDVSVISGPRADHPAGLLHRRSNSGVRRVPGPTEVSLPLFCGRSSSPNHALVGIRNLELRKKIAKL
ncbi:hypothetical protein CEB3_c46300 [Peptococcaceae bacterium CEB3]|nr:hypothetical protein CEB3_c46300 [Peptococcaceae bacterium CEB3]